MNSRIYGPNGKRSFTLTGAELNLFVRKVIDGASNCQTSNNRCRGELSIMTKEQRIYDIEDRKKQREDLFNFNLEASTPLPPLKVILLVDTKNDYAELSICLVNFGSKFFEGTIIQVIDLLDFMDPIFEIEIRDGDKVFQELDFNNVDTQHEISISDADLDFPDHSDGWEPSSPEFCSDSEKEVFYPND